MNVRGETIEKPATKKNRVIEQKKQAKELKRKKFCSKSGRGP